MGVCVFDCYIVEMGSHSLQIREVYSGIIRKLSTQRNETLNLSPPIITIYFHP